MEKIANIVISAAAASANVRFSVKNPATMQPAAMISAPIRAAEWGFARSAKRKNTGNTVTRNVDTVPTSPKGPRSNHGWPGTSSANPRTSATRVTTTSTRPSQRAPSWRRASVYHVAHAPNE